MEKEAEFMVVATTKNFGAQRADQSVEERCQYYDKWVEEGTYETVGEK